MLFDSLLHTTRSEKAADHNLIKPARKINAGTQIPLNDPS